MRRVALICSALLLVAASVEAQPILKRDDSPAPAASKNGAALKKARAARRGRAPVVDTRPRLKRDDTPTPVTGPGGRAGNPGKRRIRAPSKPRDSAAEPAPAGAPAASAKATVRDFAVCAQTKQADAAIEGCSRIIDDPKQKPKGRASAYFNRANALVQKGDSDKAIADFDEAIKLDPRNVGAYNNRGSAKNEKGDVDAALEDFDAAIKHNARFASAYFNRANVLAARGESARAIKDYDTAIKYNRRNVNAYIARGALMLASGATAKARSDFRAAATLDRRNAYTLLWHDIAERRARQKGVLTGANATRGLDMNAWPAPVLQLFTGEIKQEAVLAAADNADATLKQARTCEANFYGGEYALISGEREGATKLFEAAAKECPHGFLEGIAAGAELKSLSQKVGAN
jgi:lipoprotein NlpI